MDNSWDNLLPEQCDWCPLKCRANRKSGDAGLCGADDKLYVANTSLHFWEEPPISGTFGGPKRDVGPGSGTVFFSNCNMKCVYCQNNKISGVNKNPLGKTFDLDNLVDAILDLQKQGAMNINFVTGTHYRSHIISAVRIAKQKGLSIPVVWNSSSFESLASIYALNNIVDVWLMDFKYSDDKLAKDLSKNIVNNYVDTALAVIDAISGFVEKATFDNFKENIRMTSGVIVRHLLLPGLLENSKKALEILFDNFGNDIKYSIMNQYTPVISKDDSILKKYPDLIKTVSNDEYEELLDYADNLGIKDYYWQNGETCKESFIPIWD